MVLVIENDFALLEWIADILTTAGFQVEHLPDDRDPVAFVEQTSPQVIVTGLHATTRHGTRVAAELRKNPVTAAIPLVLYRIPRHSGGTSSSSPGSGVILFLPRDFPILASAVARALRDLPPSGSPG